MATTAHDERREFTLHPAVARRGAVLLCMSLQESLVHRDEGLHVCDKAPAPAPCAMPTNGPPAALSRSRRSECRPLVSVMARTKFVLVASSKDGD